MILKKLLIFPDILWPFIQYNFVRIKSLLKKVEITEADFNPEDVVLNVKELELIKSISNFPKLIMESSKKLSPYLLAKYFVQFS